VSALCREIRKGFRGPVTHKFVLMTIATYADLDGLAWPGQKTLADDVGISERQVRNIADKLKESGWLRIEQRGDGRGHSTRSNRQAPKGGTGLPPF
jgi:hypothetical protein